VSDPLSLQGERARVRVLWAARWGVPVCPALVCSLSRWRERAGVRVGGSEGGCHRYARALQGERVRACPELAEGERVLRRRAGLCGPFPLDEGMLGRG